MRGLGWTQRSPGRSKSDPAPSDRRLVGLYTQSKRDATVVQGGLREVREGRCNRCKRQSKEGPLHSKRVKKGP